MLLFVLLLNSSAHGSGFLMGRIVTVNPYGAEDTIRNPALLALQSDYNSIGISGDYQTDISSDISQRELSLSLFMLDVEGADNFSARLSYSRRIDTFVVGVNFSNSLEMSKITHREIHLTPSLTLGQGPFETRDRIHSGTFSVAMQLGPSHSIGFRSDVIYQKNSEINRAKALINPPPIFFHEYSTKANEQVIISPSLGYHFRTGTTGIGIVVSPGEPSWTKIEQKSERILFIPVPSIEFKGKKTLPYAFNYKTGPGITAGLYWKRPYSAGMGIEFNLVLPISFDDRSLLEIGKFFLVEASTLRTTIRVHVEPAVSLRGGIELHVSPTTLLSLGGSLNHMSFTSRIMDNNPLSPEFMGDVTIGRTSLILTGSWGLDFLIGASNAITLGAEITHASIENKSLYKHPIQTINKKILISRTKIKSLNIDLISSMSFAF